MTDDKPRLEESWFIRSRMKLRHIQLLVELDRTGTMQQAADTMGIAQPAASRLLSDLEEALGRQIFDRRGRSLVPNYFGEILTRRAKAIIAELDGARDEFNAVMAGHSGHVALGAIDGPAIDLLADVTTKTQIDHPLIELEIRTGSTARLTEMLCSGQIDFMIARIDENLDFERFAYQDIGAERLALVAGAGHRLASQGALTLQDLQRCSWVLQNRGTKLRQRVEALFVHEGLRPPERIVNTNSLAMTLACLRRSDSLSIISEAVALQQAAFGQLDILPLPFEISISNYGVVIPRHRPTSPAQRLVLETIEHCLAHSSQMAQMTHDEGMAA
ncbi:LysR substrate-binding domain-containing protein [Acidomonas methanolica]|uniref:Transcriptional regulator LysR n=1 Tax=Acidomonas methanolica NBRC 104435 TaxID=1231351 RepID=A0A023D1J9_ACIMT|nr:LysR substrate-binding domain-containing protein [Acidomonas methanolica]MBU2652840.1 LysR family transcriptional regulator [Acidomonas methanolica]TCS31244.1 LysR family transcriptional regulator [Acidomonas methanolica]GAJ27954.1 transcriptional regulator LysR [Acidomonas methanolica NBRC 104435]GEK98509.1 LysR family transcriptional regulator [Acidomonas methanolica NBRC 104435]